MKKILLIGVALLVIPSQASGQNDGRFQFDDPNNGATVGPVFTAYGEATREVCAKSGFGPISVQDSQGNRGWLNADIKGDAGHFYFKVDLREKLVIDGAPPNRGAVPSPGRITISLGSLSADANCSARLAVNYVQQNAKNRNEPASTESPTPSPTPTETVTPEVTPTVKVVEQEGIDPVLALAAGAVAGGALTAGAEYSWHRYRRRRRGKGN